MGFTKIASTVYLALAVVIVGSVEIYAQSVTNYGLPNTALKSALDQLVTVVPSQKSLETIQKFRVDKNKFKQGEESGFGIDNTGNAFVPFSLPDTFIIQLNPNINSTELDSLMDKYNFRVIEKYSNIGQLKVETDLSKYFKTQLDDNSINDSILRGVVAASEDFKKDPRIQGATPATFLATKNLLAVTNLDQPTAVFESSISAGERTDWGISDIEADKLWGMPGADNGVIIGVMDTGFARHEDIVFSRISDDVPAANHGNHVSGIACAKHNGIGVKGVIPNCFVRPRVGEFADTSPGGGNVLQFYVTFSQILKTLNEFIPTRFEIKTYNISLGYNWMPNFGINPDASDSIIYRKLVESQGEMFISVLGLANNRDKVIFSAAGNDSHDLSDPIDALFASPFNWAAITMRNRGLANNGVVVEAHDKQGNRTSFSNEKGHISCPGLHILSTLAFKTDANGNPAKSRNSYGELSGTSMASPYCAAAHSLLSLLRPKYSGVELLNCMLQSPLKTNIGTPRLKLTEALKACPKRT